jgi:hypothetical protein
VIFIAFATIDKNGRKGGRDIDKLGKDLDKALLKPLNILLSSYNL